MSGIINRYNYKKWKKSNLINEHAPSREAVPLSIRESKMEGVATKLLGRDTLRPHRQKFDILITKIYELV